MQMQQFAKRVISGFSGAVADYKLSILQRTVCSYSHTLMVKLPCKVLDYMGYVSSNLRYNVSHEEYLEYNQVFCNLYAMQSCFPCPNGGEKDKNTSAQLAAPETVFPDFLPTVTHCVHQLLWIQRCPYQQNNT